MTDIYDADSSLRVSFTPTTIREHFEGHDCEEEVSALPDALLAAVAAEVLLSDEALLHLFGDLCCEIAERALERRRVE